MELSEARQIVREFVSRWSAQKLFDVLAFAQDGKMDYVLPCCCLLGVSTAIVLHEWIQGLTGNVNCPDWEGHMAAFDASKFAGDGNVEQAYLILGYPLEYSNEDRRSIDQILRNREFIAILESVIAERETASVSEEVPCEILQ